MEMRSHGGRWDSEFFPNLGAVHPEAIPLLEHTSIPFGNLIEDLVQVKEDVAVRAAMRISGHLHNRRACSLSRALFVEEAVAKDPLQPGVLLESVHPSEGLRVLEGAEERLLHEVVCPIEPLAQAQCEPEEPVPRSLEEVGDAR